MNNLFIRIITGAISGSLFFYLYILSQITFTLLLITLLIFIFITEWSKLWLNKKTFWLVSIFYPITPVAILIYLNHIFRPINILIPIYPFIIAWTYDTGAYCTGKLIGKHKICPKISPGKTMEGLIGGLISVIIINFIIIKYNPLFYLLGLSENILTILVQSSIITIAAFTGDIFISYLKRKAKLKDSGKILPGHGGLLDRFDSVFFVIIIVLIFILQNK